MCTSEPGPSSGLSTFLDMVCMLGVTYTLPEENIKVWKMACDDDVPNYIYTGYLFQRVYISS